MVANGAFVSVTRRKSYRQAGMPEKWIFVFSWTKGNASEVPWFTAVQFSPLTVAHVPPSARKRHLNVKILSQLKLV